MQLFYLRLVPYNFQLLVMMKLRMHLSTKEATRLDVYRLSSLFMVLCIPPHMAYIINVSLHRGTAPMDFKIASVIPLYKKSDKIKEEHYGPISVLSSVSKILENVVFHQISDYFSKYYIRYDFQSGFRQGSSTDTTWIYLIDFIWSDLNVILLGWYDLISKRHLTLLTV